MIEFPDAASNEAALPQLGDVLTRLLTMPLCLRIAAGPETGKLNGLVAVLQRRFPTQLTVAGASGESVPADLAILPGATEAASTFLPQLWRAGKPVMLYAGLDARQVVETYRESGGAGAAVKIQWFHRTDAEALWDAAWASVRELGLVKV